MCGLIARLLWCFGLCYCFAVFKQPQQLVYIVTGYVFKQLKQPINKPNNLFMLFAQKAPKLARRLRARCDINPQSHSRLIYSAMDIINASVAMSSFFHS